MPFPVTDLVGFFSGAWSLRREIRDSADGWLGRFVGSAEFVPDGSSDAVLVYRERGELELDGYRGEAFRTYHFRVTGVGRADVYFDYGDFFHDVDLRQGCWRTRHPCRDDLYDGEYEVVDPDRWRWAWSVAGPAKNHRLVSEYRRVTGVRPGHGG